VARLVQRALLVLTVLTMLAASLAGIADAASNKESTKGKDAAPAKSKAATDSAKGKGVVDATFGFGFSAKNQSPDPTTDNSATGKFIIKYGNHRHLFDKGKVQCLEATSAGGANLVGHIKKSNGGDKGGYASIDAFDSGQPNGQGDLFDAFYSSTPQTCQPPSGAGTPLQKGNIVVHSTTP
jgi:hypothetical protein